MSLQYMSLPNVSPDEADVLILPVPYGRTVTYRQGTEGAPEAILAASNQLEFFEEDARWCPTLHMHVCVLDPVAQRSREGEGAYHGRLAEVASGLSDKALFIALGGEHSITPSLVAGRVQQPATIVFLDAHADLRSSYEGSVYNHACPAHRLRDMGHSLLQIGMRSLCEDEARRIGQDPDICVYFERDLRRADVWESLMARLADLQGPVWLSVDMDSFDPGLVPGVGTPQPGGLGWDQAVDIFEAVLGNARVDVRGMDIVELVPDATYISEMTAAKLVQKAMSFWGKANGFEKAPRHDSQTLIEYR